MSCAVRCPSQSHDVTLRLHSMTASNLSKGLTNYRCIKLPRIRVINFPTLKCEMSLTTCSIYHLGPEDVQTVSPTNGDLYPLGVIITVST